MAQKLSLRSLHDLLQLNPDELAPMVSSFRTCAPCLSTAHVDKKRRLGSFATGRAPLSLLSCSEVAAHAAMCDDGTSSTALIAIANAFISKALPQPQSSARNFLAQSSPDLLKAFDVTLPLRDDFALATRRCSKPVRPLDFVRSLSAAFKRPFLKKDPKDPTAFTLAPHLSKEPPPFQGSCKLLLVQDSTPPLAYFFLHAPPTHPHDSPPPPLISEPTPRKRPREPPLAERPTLEVRSAAEFEQWLSARHATHPSVWVLSVKKSFNSNLYLPLSDLIDVALCWGWIDSVGHKHDERLTATLFSPRRSKSNWSAVNKKKVEQLLRAGRMQAPGLSAVDEAKRNGCWDALKSVDALEVPEDLAVALKGGGGQSNWDAFPPSARRGILEWVFSAKTEETRARRVREAAEKAARGERAFSGGSKRPKTS